MENLLKQDEGSNAFYENFRSNPETSFINHHDIYSLLMAKLPHKDKLEILNKITKADKPFEDLKGFNKPFVISNVVNPIIKNNSPEEIINFKKEVNGMKDAMQEKYNNFVKTEKGEIKFIESKLSTTEYLKYLTDNKESIINAKKNENSISSAMLLLAYNESKQKSKFLDILTKSGVPSELATDFIKSSIFEHNNVTNEIKKLTARAINSDVTNVNTFKKLTKLEPSSKQNVELKEESKINKKR